MKKPNINLNVDAIKKWGLQHGEKVALGVVGALFFFFLFRTVTTEHYEGNTRGLISATETAKNNLANPDSWEISKQAKNYKNLPYHVVAKKLTEPIQDSDSYQWGHPMLQKLKLAQGKAREPKFLTALGPLAAPGRGGFEILEDKNDDNDRRDRLTFVLVENVTQGFAQARLAAAPLVDSQRRQDRRRRAVVPAAGQQRSLGRKRVELQLVLFALQGMQNVRRVGRGSAQQGVDDVQAAHAFERILI